VLRSASRFHRTSFAWLHAFRRLKIRYERCAHVHEAFLSLARSLICWSQLKAASDQFRSSF